VRLEGLGKLKIQITYKDNFIDTHKISPVSTAGGIAEDGPF
jgi:hypothetical protein